MVLCSFNWHFLAARPPVEETSSFLTALLNAHGSEFFVRLLGPKAKNALADMGGIDKVSVTISRKFFHTTN